MEMQEYEGWDENDYVALLHPESFSRRFLNREFYPFQRALAENIMRQDRVLVLCARQLGKTEAISMIATWYLYARPNVKILIFAPMKDQAVDNLFGRIRTFIKNNPKLLQLVYKDPVNGKLRLGADNVQMINGSTARAMSASEDANIEGWTGDLVLLDESQNISDVTFYKKIMPMVTATGGKVVQIGTPRSRNHFYESYKDTKNWKVLKFDWKHGTATYKKSVKNNKAIMPPEDFKTEYELQWIDSDSLYFDSKQILSAFTDKYTMPLITEADKYMGIDLGKLRDKTVVTVVANEGGIFRTVNILTPAGDYSEQQRQILQIIDRYQPKRVLVDATGLGTTFLDFLQNESPHPYKIEGYLMTAKNKSTELYPNLKLLFSSGRIELAQHSQLETELLELRRSITKSGIETIHHPPRGHDDFVDSLALACFSASPFEKKAREPMVMKLVDNGDAVYGKVMRAVKEDDGKIGIRVWGINSKGEITVGDKTS